MNLDQETGHTLISLEALAVFNPVLVFPVVILDTDVQLLFAQVERLAQVVFDLWIEVQVGVVFAFVVDVVVDHPVHEAVDQDVRIADRNGVGPGRRDLPDIVAGT